MRTEIRTVGERFTKIGSASTTPTYTQDKKRSEIGNVRLECKFNNILFSSKPRECCRVNPSASQLMSLSSEKTECGNAVACVKPTVDTYEISVVSVISKQKW